MRESPQSKLGRALVNSSKAPAHEPEQRFAKAVAAARVREPFVIPRLNIPAVMTLVPHYRVNQIEADVIEELERRLQIPLNATTELNYEAERAARYLAEAAIDPDSITSDGGGDWRPIGTLPDWRAMDQDVIGDCWRIYGDVRSAYDPIGVGVSQEEIELIEEIVKKNADPPEVRLKLLRLAGVRRLSSYLLTTAGRLADSTIPESSGGPSPSD